MRRATLRAAPEQGEPRWNNPPGRRVSGCATGCDGARGTASALSGAMLAALAEFSALLDTLDPEDVEELRADLPDLTRALARLSPTDLASLLVALDVSTGQSGGHPGDRRRVPLLKRYRRQWPH